MLQGTNQQSDDGELFVDGIHLTDLGMCGGQTCSGLAPVSRYTCRSNIKAGNYLPAFIY